MIPFTSIKTNSIHSKLQHMKASKLILSGLFALAFAGVSHGQAPIKIFLGGANGDRANVAGAVANLLQGETHAGTATTVTSSNFSIFRNGTFNGTPVTVYTSFLGATPGIAAVASDTDFIKFLPDTATDGAVNADPTASGNSFQTHKLDFAFSTNYQTSSPFIGTYQGTIYETLEHDDLLVALPIQVLGSPGYPGDNITNKQAQALWGAGALPLSVFTGSSGDHHKIVYATGRNLDAGQRFGFQAEAGIGIFSVVKQYKPTISGQTTAGGVTWGGTVDSHALFPANEAVSSGGTSGPAGNSGVNTGANLATALTATLGPTAYKLLDANATAGYYLSYVTPQDANNIALNPAHDPSTIAVPLKWNGVDYTPQNVIEGKYTLWVYEHLFYNSAFANSTDTEKQFIKTFADALATAIKNLPTSVNSVKLTDIQVSRQTEGGLVTPDFF